MKTFKEQLKNYKKEELYDFYSRFVSEPKKIDRITKLEMYEEVLKIYKEAPEVILSISNFEEIDILRDLINEKPVTDFSYIDYLALNNLKSHWLVLNDKEYYIPEDFKNYIKMALNLFNDQEFIRSELTDNLFLGIVRTYNVMLVTDLLDILKDYQVTLSGKELHDKINNNVKLNNKMKFVKYKESEYLVSLEQKYYRDVLGLRKPFVIPNHYSLESLASIGKYNLNLFDEEILKFLNFLEMHLEPIYTEQLINDIVFLAGLEISEENVIQMVCDNIPELMQEVKKVLPHFPSWLSKGNTILTLKSHVLGKNDLCYCGSGKKYKNCCMQKKKVY